MGALELDDMYLVNPIHRDDARDIWAPGAWRRREAIPSGLHRPGSFVRLSLTDTGSGLASEHLPHIFEPLLTTKDVVEHTGPSLVTGHGIGEPHRGGIDVESQPGSAGSISVEVLRRCLAQRRRVRDGSSGPLHSFRATLLGSDVGRVQVCARRARPRRAGRQHRPVLPPSVPWNAMNQQITAHRTVWYHLTVSEMLQQLGSGPQGLSAAEVRQRLQQNGYNELSFQGRSALLRFLRQFHHPLIYVLLAAAAICAVLTMTTQEDMWSEVIIILLVVVLNTIIGFVQEGKAERALDALRKMMVPECRVLRDGREQVIATRELVPGDLVLLQGGDKVPADLRLVQGRNLYADEAPLTGESTPVGKTTEPIARPNLSPGDQRCMVFSGTFITRGAGQGMVVATGERTEFGRIAMLMKETKTVPTPLQQKLATFSMFLLYAILALAAVNFVMALLFGYPAAYAFLASVALAVAAVPEMLPPLVTIVLALAATVMAHRKALIRKLPAAETLGCVTVICSDKTGTLTKNQMTVTRIGCGGSDYLVHGTGYEPHGSFERDGRPLEAPLEDAVLAETLRVGHACSDATLIQEDGAWGIMGDPTEGALVVAAAKAGLSGRAARLDTIPFESDQQYMATLHAGDAENLIYIKGSPERLLCLCRKQLGAAGDEPLDVPAIHAKAAEMASQALRVLAMARKSVPREHVTLTEADLHDLTFLGLQGMIDPPREEAITAVADCRLAGIRPVMITGDHARTAQAIAGQLGMDAEHVLTGEQLATLPDEQLREEVERVSVHARVAPEHKYRIATQLQRRGHVVAMTGDGVNDAPALKAADIGVAMGITGTEVSKEASAMVLADDNFATIIAAVEEGRHAWNNIEKAILYTLPTNGGQALLIGGAVLVAPFVPLFREALPLAPVHILWVNMADSIFLTLPLVLEPKEAGLLRQPPRNPREKIANRLFFQRVGLVSLVMAFWGFLTYKLFGGPALAGDTVDTVRVTQAQTAAFMAIMWVHLGYLFTARRVHDSAFTFSPVSNRWLLLGAGLTLLCQAAITYVPFLQDLFRTAAFPIEWWWLVVAGFIPGFFAVELEKYLRRIWKRRASGA
jgi:P-type Ca2+ transporter type 2C